MDDQTEGILLVDANNAFNELNRQVALLNMYAECPSIAIFLDGEELLSQEGTTQGGPEGMPMYGLGILPLIRNLENVVRQMWYADD